MTARRTRAGPSGWVRPCSQFLTVAAVNPKRAANRAWLRPSFWRTDRTSTMGARSTLTMVTRTGTSSPPAHAIACLTLRMSLRPAAVCFSVGRFRIGFGISGSPFQVSRYEDRKQPLQAAFIGFRKIRLLILGVDVQREYWNRLFVVVVDDARAAPLSLPLGSPSDLPDSTGSWHQSARFRVRAKVRHQDRLLGFCQDGRGVVQAFRHLHYRHRRHHRHMPRCYAIRVYVSSVSGDMNRWKYAEGKREDYQEENSSRGARPEPRPPLSEPLLLFFGLFVFAAFARRFQALLAALGPVGRALHQLAAHQLDHRLLGAVALARSQAHDARIAAVALSEPRAQSIEQLLEGIRRAQHHGRLAARVQRIRLGQRDHVLHQRTNGFRLRNRGDDALRFDDAGDQVAQERIAAAGGPLQFVSGVLMSHALLSQLRLAFVLGAVIGHAAGLRRRRHQPAMLIDAHAQ